METQHLPWLNTSSQELKRQTWLKICSSVFATGEWNTEKKVFKGWLNKFSIHYLTAELTVTFKPHWSHGTDTETNHSQYWSLLSQLQNLLGKHPDYQNLCGSSGAATYKQRSAMRIPTLLTSLQLYKFWSHLHPALLIIFSRFIIHHCKVWDISWRSSVLQGYHFIPSGIAVAQALQIILKS